MAIIEVNLHQQQQPKAIEASPQSQSVRTLPTEIIVQVLLKLPVESLLRCKSVCKLWCSLISDPYFVTSHLNLSAQNNKRLIFNIACGSILNSCCIDDAMNGNFIINGLEVPLKSVTESVSVLGSCNGLLCLHIFGSNYDYDILCIWNPSTRKYHKVPSDADTTNVIEVAFGFGYDESTNDFKVVSVSRKLRINREETFFKVYSSRSGSWKDLDAFSHDLPCRYNGKFLNGALHWLASDDDYSEIISLDLATETFGEVLQPVYDEGEKELTLGTLGEWLCVLCDYNEIRVDLWAMKVYGVNDSWTKLASVPYMPDQTIDDFLASSNDERILLTSCGKLMIYDPKRRSFLDVKSFDKRVEASTFAESLVSPIPMPPATALGHRVAGSSG